MNQRRNLNERRTRRMRRVRAKIRGTHKRPRLAIFRSNRFMYAQLIDAEAGRTLVHVSSREQALQKETKASGAARIGELLAERASKKGIASTVFDRRMYRYHGRVKIFVEAARKAGLGV